MSETVDSSPEAIAACVAWWIKLVDRDDAFTGPPELGPPSRTDELREAADLLAQVARERDEAVERIARWCAENGGRYWEARFRDEEIRAEVAERRLAEARAALRDVVHAFTGSIAQFGGNASWNPAVAKARALLSGETT